jgi:hypothetical protein
VADFLTKVSPVPAGTSGDGFSTMFDGAIGPNWNFSTYNFPLGIHYTNYDYIIYDKNHQTSVLPRNMFAATVPGKGV